MPAKTATPAQASRARGETGSVTVFVVLVAIGLIAVAGLVIDGGYTMAAKRQADGEAEQAARAGADALSRAALRSDLVRLNPQQARIAAETYLHSIGAHGSCATTGATVTCTVTKQQPMAILSAVGVSHLTVHGTASARSIDEGTPP